MGQRAVCSGFTLVEMLLAVTLMSMLLALAYGGLRASTRASESGQVLLEETSSIRATHQFIRRRLNQMQPLPFGEAEDLDESRIVFEGSARHIQYVAPMPGYLGRGGPQVQMLELVPGEDGDELLFRHALLQGFESQYLYERDPIVLLQGIEGASFAFLGRDEEGLVTGWMSTWDTPEVLPAAVQLDIVFPEDQRAIWPLLAAGVKVDEIAVTSSAAMRSYSEAIRELMKNNRGKPRS